MSRNIFAVLIILMSSACAFPPGGDDYPYGMFDADIERFAQLLRDGSRGDLVHTGSFGLDAEERELLEDVWGKAKDVRVVQKEHIAMKAYYFLEISLHDGRKAKYRVVYVPNLGRVEMAFQRIESL